MSSQTYWRGVDKDDHANFEHFFDAKEAHNFRTLLLRRWNLERRLPWSARVATYWNDLSRIRVASSIAKQTRKRPHSDDVGARSDLVHQNTSTLSRFRTPFDGYRTDQEALWYWWRPSRIGIDFHGFMSLPQNVRCMVYEMLLVRGYVFINVEHGSRGVGAYENRLELYNWTNNDAPTQMRTRLEGFSDVYRVVRSKAHPQPICVPCDKKTIGAIQGVSRMFQREAEMVFWGSGNEFVFPIGRFVKPEGFWSCDSGLETFKSIKKVNIALDAHDIGIVDFYERRKLVEESLSEEGTHETLTDEDIREELHHNLAEEILEVWRMRMKVFTQLMCLHSLKLDVEECYCPMRCCRLVKDVFDQASLDLDLLTESGSPLAEPPQSLELFGVRGEREAIYVRQYFERRGMLVSSIAFRPAFIPNLTTDKLSRERPDHA